MSENMLASATLISQQYINKIINGKVRNPSTDKLLLICIALKLKKSETYKLLSLAERTLSPANPLHCACKKLLNKIASSEVDPGEQAVDLMNEELKKITGMSLIKG